MIKDGKYHKDLGFPHKWQNHIKRFLGDFDDVTPTTHFSEQADKHGFSIDKDDIVNGEVFELVYERGKIVKAGFRVNYLDEEKDIVVIVSCHGKLVTTWFNWREDKHHTLNPESYIIP